MTAPAPVDLIHVRDHRFKKRPAKAKGCAECGRAKTNMVHVGAPQSLNAEASQSTRFAYGNQKKAWQARLTKLLEDSGLPKGLVAVHVRGQVCFPDRTKRDQGNHRFLVEKALGDALEKGGWISNDDWTRYQFGNLDYAYDKGQSWTALTIFPSPVLLGGGA